MAVSTSRVNPFLKIPQVPASNASDPSGGAGSYGAAGSYGEGAVIKRYEALQQLKAQLDSGQITVQDFMAKAHPLAKETYRTIGDVAGRGSKAANIVNPYLAKLKDVGFSVSPTGEVLPQLDPKYESQLRQNISPDNTPDAEKKLVSQIPTDIPITSDRGLIEREGIRENVQAKAGLDDQTQYRANALKDLASILSNQATQNFQRSIPQIAEDANSAGVFRSTGYGNALATKESQLQEDLATKVGQYGYDNSQLTAAGMGDITDARIGTEQSGLQRQLSLQDFAQNRTTAAQFADAVKPQNPGKTNGEKWAQAGQIAVGGAAAGVQAKNGGKGK